MTRPADRPPGVPAEEVVAALGPLVAAEATAEAPGAAADAGDLEQAVWVRLFERLGRAGPPGDPARWVRAVVRAEVRRARRRTVRERPLTDGAPYGSGAAAQGESAEHAALRAETGRTVRSAVARTPGDCPRLLSAMLSPHDPTYREIAGELNISQGSLGPIRSRCLGCLRRMLAAEVAAPEHRGKER
ncbi:sigma-70 RNA polymerase sigma factor region 4 domain-containing protein [Streptomyces tsukubensis]|uniref:RNA polymerase subunit sigma n=1 Tax=Streptomyces tsukubensis (strain DSM 42081 / NBRC 108919 / NRRL 18488 / 9993) TaxID=1114943 RepID=A0A7G3UJL1_STRT9|nr:sigma-70 family RNA polymerase sigma factor [Streptomyces tsukubensis]AZK93224.1 RNA polymerase subunit sigma [Streptomyces tsukubensis]QKM70617.1 RNA polymerase subunit sigma [Streptomyces tsukubensis NRRL18488]TAI41289.1 sigma-70 family RNA polymerase sigma factor [Streptomyces tsukubensis]